MLAVVCSPDPVGLHLAHLPGAAVVEPVPDPDRLRGEVVPPRHVEAAGRAPSPPPSPAEGALHLDAHVAGGRFDGLLSRGNRRPRMNRGRKRNETYKFNKKYGGFCGCRTNANTRARGEYLGEGVAS